MPQTCNVHCRPIVAPTTTRFNAAYYNRIPSLSIGRTGGSGSVLPVAGVPNLFPQLLPSGRRDTHDGSKEDGAALLLDNDSLDEGDCFSVQSIVRKEAESGAPVQEDNSIGSSITPINWRSGFQNGGGAGTDHDNYYGNTPATGEAVDALPDCVDADIYRFHPGLDNDDPMDAPDNGEVPGEHSVVMEPCNFEPISHGHLERVQTSLLVLMKRFQCPLEAYDPIMDWAEFATSEPSFDFSWRSIGNKQGSVVAALTKKMGMEGL
jgi:hypothetical protein